MVRDAPGGRPQGAAMGGASLWGTRVIQAFGEDIPSIDEAAWVHETAVVIGQVRLERDVSVWPTAVLRGDMGAIVIGEDSNIQDGAVVHMTTQMSDAVVGRRVTVGHRAILHGCIVEDDCLVGMGSILLDNCVIGAGSVIAAGALVPMGRKIPPNSLVMGSPGRVVGQVSESHRRMIDFSWQTYRDKARAWREG